jgi:phage terminase large subunit-like protein
MARAPGTGKCPLLPPDTDFLDFLLRLPPEAWEEALSLFGFTEADGFDRDWPSWAHDGQQPPEEDWSTCVIMGGRGFGKTRAGAEWIVSLLGGHSGDRPRARKPLRIALVGATLAEARKVMVEGPSGLIEVAGPWIREWRPTHGLLRFRTGAQAQLFSGHSPELLRGPAHDYAWCDELAKWEKGQETWDMLQFGLRRGERPRVLVTTTPRPGPVLKGIMALPGSVAIGGPTFANPHNSEAWQRDMAARYAGTRLGRQELDGQLLPDTPGALWTEALLERCRGDGFHFPGEAASPHRGSGENGNCPQFLRLVIAVDPPSGDGTCGIIACAKDSAGIAHVLADHSVTALSPEGWARAVADAALIWSSPSLLGEGDHPEGGGGVPAPPPAPPDTGETRIWVMCPRLGRYVLQPANPPRNGERDPPQPEAKAGGGGPGPLPVLIVAEANQGGKMVAAVLRIADPGLRVRLVTATQGKTDRAAPVAMLFEAGKVLLHGRFPELEAELCGMIAGGGYEGPGVSPDRADAMVWGLTELMLQKERAEPRITIL